jgi:hypothetical protein
VNLATRKSIEDLQAAAAKLPQCELHTEHYFADGMYCRSLFRSADTLIVGKVHKAEHFYIIASGTVTIVGDGYRETVTGPKVIVSKPGTKRAVYAHTDATTMTVHRTDETDLEKIEAELIEEDETAMFDSDNKLRLGVEKLLVNQSPG